MVLKQLKWKSRQMFMHLRTKFMGVWSVAVAGLLVSGAISTSTLQWSLQRQRDQRLSWPLHRPHLSLQLSWIAVLHRKTVIVMNKWITFDVVHSYAWHQWNEVVSTICYVVGNICISCSCVWDYDDRLRKMLSVMDGAVFLLVLLYCIQKGALIQNVLHLLWQTKRHYVVNTVI